MDAFEDLTLPNSYYSEADATLIFHVAKAGSTSLLSAIAAANGIDPDELASTLPHPELAWDQAVWSGASHLLMGALSPPDRLELCEREDVKRLAFVRHPATRLWSAWISKIVVGEPRYARLRDELMGPFGETSVDATTTRQELADLFAQFIKWLPRSGVLQSDLHFIPQTSLLSGAPPDTDIYESSRLVEHLRQHLPSLARMPSSRRRNETRSLVYGPIMTAAAFEELGSIYEKDFAVFGTRFGWGYDYRWNVEANQPSRPVSPCFIDRCRGARRLTNVLREDAARHNELESLRINCANLKEELQAVQMQHHAIENSRIWRWTAGYRALRSWSWRD